MRRGHKTSDQDPATDPGGGRRPDPEQLVDFALEWHRRDGRDLPGMPLSAAPAAFVFSSDFRRSRITIIITQAAVNSRRQSDDELFHFPYPLHARKTEKDPQYENSFTTSSTRGSIQIARDCIAGFTAFGIMMYQTGPLVDRCRSRLQRRTSLWRSLAVDRKFQRETMA